MHPPGYLVPLYELGILAPPTKYPRKFGTPGPIILYPRNFDSPAPKFNFLGTLVPLPNILEILTPPTPNTLIGTLVPLPNILD